MTVITLPPLNGVTQEWIDTPNVANHAENLDEGMMTPDDATTRI